MMTNNQQISKKDSIKALQRAAQRQSFSEWSETCPRVDRCIETIIKEAPYKDKREFIKVMNQLRRSIKQETVALRRLGIKYIKKDIVGKMKGTLV